MSNEVTALNKQRYTKMVQALLEEKLVVMDLANMTLIAEMPDGNTIHFPRPEFQNVKEYIKYTDVDDQPVNFTDETLTINKTPIITFTYDDVDRLDNGYDFVSSAAPKAAYRIKQDIEGNFFNEILNANTTNGDPVELTIGASTNVTTVYGQAYAQLANDGVDTGNMVAVVDPFQMERIGSGALGNTFNTSDRAYKNGYRGMFQNMMLIVSTNLTSQSILAFGTQPTANDTVTIAWVIFTFVAAVGTDEGNVLIGTAVADTRANLISAVNGAVGGGTTYVELTTLDRSKMEWLTLTQDPDTSANVNFLSKRWYKILSSSLTAATNLWGIVSIHNAIMERWSIHCVMQKEVSIRIQDVHKQLGLRYFTWARYGLKTFSEGAERMYNLVIESQAEESVTKNRILNDKAKKLKAI